jgi:hypothetical protein
MNRFRFAVLCLKNAHDQSSLRIVYLTADMANPQSARALFTFNTAGAGKKHMYSGIIRLKMKTPPWVRGSASAPHVPESDCWDRDL